MTNLIYIAGAALLVGGLLVGFWPKIASLLAPKQPAAPTAPPSRPDLWVPVEPQPMPVTPTRELTPQELAYSEAQLAFAKLKDLEGYFTKVGSTEGLEAICRAGECMFRPPVVTQLKVAQMAAKPVAPVATTTTPAA